MPAVKSPIIEPLLQEKRQEILALAARHGARSLRIFGSFARGEAHATSDVDFLVELGPGATLIDLGSLQMDLQDLLGRKVDVVEPDAYISPSGETSSGRRFRFEGRLSLPLAAGLFTFIP